MKNETNTQETAAVMTTGKDLATSILIVSVLVNLAVLVTYLWVAIDPAIKVAVSFN